MSGAVIAAKLWAYLPQIILVLSTVAFLMAYRHWRAIHEPDEPIRDADLLADLEQGDAASKMTEAEFRRVRERLLGTEAGRNAPEKTKRSERRENVQGSQTGMKNE